MQYLTKYLDYISFVIGIIGVTAVIWGVLTGVWEFFVAEFYRFKTGGKTPISLDRIRQDIGRYLLLGLEFLISADIIRTIANPTLEDVTILAGIVGIRTVISYFLTREMKHRQKDEHKYS